MSTITAQQPEPGPAPPPHSVDAHANAARSLPYPSDEKRRKLRVAIVTENFLPKVDGVTRTLARLLEHLNAEGHEALVCGPETGMTQYAGHPVVGTFGLPLVIYPGLKLNFMRPRFIRRLQQFKPDVIHFVDPIWLGAQMLPVVQKWLPLVPCVSSYHTNLPTYATLFGMPWLENTMWNLTRSLHARCAMTFCPSESTRRMLHEKGFDNVEIWSRGVDPELFTPSARDENLRASWGCTPKPASLSAPLWAEEAALTQLADKLGVFVHIPFQQQQQQQQQLHRGPCSRSSSSSHASDDESFIRTPPSVPMLPSAMGSPEMSPPPSYDSLQGIPALPSGTFSLPPPALSTGTPSTTDAEAESKTVILYVGRISWEKNLRLLIEAFRLLPSGVRASAKLVFVGDGPARGELTRLCARLGLDATFMGHQKGKRLAAMYASSSVFAFPSFTETFGQVVLEALASGLPVVGLHAEGTSDLVSHGRTGLLLDVGSVAYASKRPQTPVSPNLSATNASKKTLRTTTESMPSITDFALAASNAASVLGPLNEKKMSASRSGSSCHSSTTTATKLATAPTSGLRTPIPSVGAFAAAMSPGSVAFTHCARSYSMLLERLVQNRALRAEMGQRATIVAARKTWWDAMDAVVRGYEEVVKQAGVSNFSDEELEALRARQRKKAPLTGPIVKAIVAIYVLLFAYLWARICL